MKTANSTLAALLVSLSFPAMAEVYRHVDEQGNVTYTDEPREGAETIRVKPVTTIVLPKQEDIGTIDIQADAQDEAPYERIEITNPEDEEAFWSASGNMVVNVASTPALREGHMYEVTLDGQIVGQSTNGTIALDNVYRGTHQAQVRVVDSRGRPVQDGESISFTLHQPSRQTPPTPNTFP